MRPDIKAAFLKYEIKHYAAVQADTELGICSDAKYTAQERIANKFWDNCKTARQELMAILDSIP
jgi:hypothetical protein